MERLNYREVVEKLDAIDRRLCEMGLSQFDRIRIHRRNITELAEASEAGKLNQIAAALTGERRREILWSFVESIELVDAVDALDSQGSPAPRALLERALKGPADVYLEDHKSNDGRNTMFEIVIAGAVALNGSHPHVGGEPDVRFYFKDRNMLVQCKRVLSESAIAKRISEAGKQLTRDLSLSLDPRDCGIIAISVSRIVNPGDKMLNVESEADLGTALEREIDRIIHQNERALREVKAPKIAGVLFYLSTPAFVAEHQLFTVAHFSTLFPIPGKPDKSLLKELATSWRF